MMELFILNLIEQDILFLNMMVTYIIRRLKRNMKQKSIQNSLKYVKKVIIIDGNEKHYKFNIIQSDRLYSLSVKANNETKKWIKLIEKQCNIDYTK